MANQLIQLVYVSSASKDITDADLREIQKVAIERNGRDNITGILLYRSGRFFQLLEGSQDAVNDLYKSILLDDRHHDLNLLFSRPCMKRSAAFWSMGVINLDEFSASEDPTLDRLVELGSATLHTYCESEVQQIIRLMTSVFSTYSVSA